VLAVVTAVIDAHGADHAISAGTLAAYRPALAVITGIAVLGLAVTLAGLRPIPAARAKAPAAASPGPQGTGRLGSGSLPPGQHGGELEGAGRR
jgi:hypothetical protein